jgi:hypothetical protein
VQRPAEDFLGPPARVAVGGVERGDALVKRGPDTLGRGLLRYLLSVGDPVPVRDLADDQAAFTQVSVFHDP